MAGARKTWRQKLESPQQAEVVDDRRGRGKLLVPRSLNIDALIRQDTSSSQAGGKKPPAVGDLEASRYPL